MTHLLLLHGAGLGAWIWDRVIPHLDAPSDALELPRPHLGVAEAAELIAQNAQPSLVVAHSFSAMFALAAATAHPEKFAGIVCVGGVVPESGKSFLSLLPPPMRLFMRVVLARSKDGVRIPQKLIAKQYCNDLDAATTELVLSRVVPESPRLYSDRVQWIAQPNVSYVRLTEDRSAPPKTQDRMIERIHASRIDELATGHLPMLAQPRALAELLNRYTRSSG